MVWSMFGMILTKLRVLTIIGLLVCGMGACATPATVGSKIGKTRGHSDPLVVAGDWDDVAAALFGALRDQEVAVLSEKSGPTEQSFELLTIRDEPGLVVARQGSEGAITLSCVIGPFGDPDRERMLLARMSQRLKELAGVGARPMSW